VLKSAAAEYRECHFRATMPSIECILVCFRGGQTMVYTSQTNLVTISSGVWTLLEVKVCPFPQTLKVVLTTLALPSEV